MNGQIFFTNIKMVEHNVFSKFNNESNEEMHLDRLIELLSSFLFVLVSILSNKFTKLAWGK